MPTFSLTPKTSIKHKGLFDRSKLIKTIQDWFGKHKYDFHAPKYKYRPDEIELEFKGERKINPYVRFRMLVVVKGFEIKNVEVVKDGEKKKMQQGRLNVEISPEYDLDYKKRFGGNKFLQALQDFFHKYIIKRTIEEVWEDQLFMHQTSMIREIREVLGHEH